MVKGLDSNVVNGFEKLWHEASIHDLEKGQTSGINQEEFNGMSLFLNEAINNSNASEETKDWAQKKLDDLKLMLSSSFNKKNLIADIEKSAPKGLWNNIKDLFTKSEQDYYEENVISYETMLTYNGGGINAVIQKDNIGNNSIFNFSDNPPKTGE